MNTEDFVTKLHIKCKDLGIRIKKEDLNKIVNEFVLLLKESIYDYEYVRMKNFATFYLTKTSDRLLPNKKTFKERPIIKVRLSKNFKFKE